MNMKPLVQTYLLNKTLNSLHEEHGIDVSISKTRPYKFSLNYSQIDSKEGDVLANQCRGLIVRTVDGSPAKMDAPLETTILARPFDRFLNYGQGFAAEINWNNCHALEKVDGTLCIWYFDDIANDW